MDLIIAVRTKATHEDIMLNSNDVVPDKYSDEFDEGLEEFETSDRQQDIEDADVEDGLALTAKEAFQKLKKRAASPKLEGRGMLISGPSGTGKSHVWHPARNLKATRRRTGL
jgi:DNA replication protein DnaC